MQLSDTKIIEYMEREEDPLIIDPYPEDSQFQSASVDLRLGPGFITYYSLPPSFCGELSVNNAAEVIVESFEDVGFIILYPNDFILCETLEKVKIPADLVGRIEGKSSIGRMGLTVHVTAGFFDPGFGGKATLEVKNLNPVCSVKLYLSQPVCQMAFEQVLGRVSRPYGSAGLGSKYQNATGVEAYKSDS